MARHEERAEARAAIDQALESLRAEERLDVLPDIVPEALNRAKEALSGLTECRKATPYAELILVADDSGLHYVCTHSPEHRF
jgi:hypothetical protein